MRLFIVIVCYRVVDLTIDCLHSLSGEIGRVPGTRVGLLENGTGGDAGERLRQVIDENGWNSWVDLTVVETNLGFTGGNNLLIRPALASADPPDYVLLLNADTIVKEHSLDALVEFMDSHPRAGIAGSRQVWPSGEVRASPFRFLSLATELDGGLKLGVVSRILSRWTLEPPKPTVTTRADWVSGACMIFAAVCSRRSDSWTRDYTLTLTMSTFACEPRGRVGRPGTSSRAISFTWAGHRRA